MSQERPRLPLDELIKLLLRAQERCATHENLEVVIGASGNLSVRHAGQPMVYVDVREARVKDHCPTIRGNVLRAHGGRKHEN